MKKSLSTTLVIAAALAGLTAMASAQTGYRGDQGQATHGQRDAGNWGQGGGDVGDWRQGDGNSRYRNQSSDIAGTWRLQSRQGDVDGANRGRGGRQSRGWFGNRIEYGLPNVIQIERFRRELQVMGPNGQSLRTIDSGRGRGQGGTLRSTGGSRGATFTEYYSLQNRGRQLVIRTVVSGNRDSREFTSVYQRS